MDGSRKVLGRFSPSRVVSDRSGNALGRVFKESVADATGVSLARYSASSVKNRDGSVCFRFKHDRILTSTGFMLFRADQNLEHMLESVVAWLVFFSENWQATVSAATASMADDR